MAQTRMYYGLDTTLRAVAPGFHRLSQPQHVKYPFSMETLKAEHDYDIVKNKAEIIDEHRAVMHKVYNCMTKAALALVFGLYAGMILLNGGGSTWLALTMVAVAYAMYYWWKGGAAYSNWQEFEFRPVLLPVEDIRKYQG